MVKTIRKKRRGGMNGERRRTKTTKIDETTDRKNDFKNTGIGERMLETKEGKNNLCK